MFVNDPKSRSFVRWSGIHIIANMHQPVFSNLPAQEYSRRALNIFERNLILFNLDQDRRKYIVIFNALPVYYLYAALDYDETIVEFSKDF